MIDNDDGDRADEPVGGWYEVCWASPMTPCFLDPDDKPIAPPAPKPIPANALRHRPGWEQS